MTPFLKTIFVLVVGLVYRFVESLDRPVLEMKTALRQFDNSYEPVATMTTHSWLWSLGWVAIVVFAVILFYPDVVRWHKINSDR